MSPARLGEERDRWREHILLLTELEMILCVVRSVASDERRARFHRLRAGLSRGALIELCAYMLATAANESESIIPD